MKKLIRSAAAIVSAAALAFSGTVPAISQTALTVSAADTNNDDWLHAEGSRLYDKDGHEVWLTGANWFGFNCGENVLHYLWSADADDCLREIADRGINILRFPISTELIVSWMNGKPDKVGSFSCNTDPSFTINPDFCAEDGKSPKNSMEIFDIMIQKCKKYGIKVFIDIHSPDANNSGHNYNLWYGKAGVTTDVWIDSLVWLADKYKNDDTLLAYDLKNEPHGKGPEGKAAAKWDGSTDENNWAYAATKCAEAILDVNPNALILVEGVEQSMSGAMEGDYWGMADRRDNSPYIGAWWGGNFRGAREFPIKPKQGTSQIVYSPHDYGPSVYAQTWFEKDFTEQTLLDDYWYDTWAYINAEDIGPELIGEWGGHMDGAENQKWMTLLRDYMINNHINHTFWCLNTNSGDTGGLWDDLGFQSGKGTTIKWNEPKYKLFEEALWQTKSGKYIGLDHEIPLGSNGLSLSQFYASGESSNLDGGKGSTQGSTKPVAAASTTTTAPKPVTTTSTTTTTTAPVKTVKCEHCGKEIPKSEAIYGPLGFPVCRECYDNGAYVGTTANFNPPTTTTTTTTAPVKGTTYPVFGTDHDVVPYAVSIITEPTKTVYNKGEKLDLSGIKVQYNDTVIGAESIKLLSEYKQGQGYPALFANDYEFDSTKEGTYRIIISFSGRPDTTPSDGFTVTVGNNNSNVPRPGDDDGGTVFELRKAPDKTEYKIGEQIDLTGIQIDVGIAARTPIKMTVPDVKFGKLDEYVRGENVILTTDFDSTKAGTYTVRLVLDGSKELFTVKVVDDGNNNPDVKYGDSNCDGNVDISDAVLIMQSLSNPSKYKLTAKGSKNADCSNTGDGVTNTDALAIQKYMLQIIASLPEVK